MVCFFIFWQTIYQPLCCQVAYSKDFQLKEGLYLSIQQFRTNSPVPKSQILSDYNKNELSFFDQLVSNKNIRILNSLGVEEELESTELWGYSKNNAVYINYQGVFCRIGVIGNLCHFVANITTYVSVPDPFYGMRFGGSTVPVKELKQFVLEVETGKIYDFNVEAMEYFLKSDNVLYSEYAALKRRKKKDASFSYLRKYNEKHPLYFP